MSTQTVVAGVLASGRAVDVDTFVDVTPVTVSSVVSDEGLVIATFDGALTAEQTATVLRRISMPQSVEAAFTALETRVAALESSSPETT